MPNYAQNYASTIDSSLVAIPEIFVQMQGSNTGNSSICSMDMYANLFWYIPCIAVKKLY